MNPRRLCKDGPMERIVVGVDGSDESWAGFDAALRLASTEGASVTAVHAEHLSAWSSLGLGATLGEVYEADERIREQLEAEARERGRELVVEIGVVTRSGRPAGVLIDVAKELDADLIVVGHRGHGGATSWIGSVANEVVHRSPISVLIAR